MLYSRPLLPIESLTRAALVALALSLSRPSVAAAQDDWQVAPPSDSGARRRELADTARAIVDRYIAAALRDNLALTGQRAATRRVASALREARGRALPTVGVNARYSEYSGVIDFGDFINPAYAALNQALGENRFPTNLSTTLPLRQETRVELTQPLFAPAIGAGVRVARAVSAVADAREAGAVRRLAADVQLAWIGYAASTRVIETLEAAATVLDENVRVSTRLVQAGSATPDVPLRARAERSELQGQLAEARRARDAARRAFNQLLARDPESAIELPAGDPTLPVASIDALSRASLEAHALSMRSEVKEGTAAERVARANGRAAASAFLPTVALSASYGVQGQQYRFDRRADVGIASLVMSWNLFNGGQDVARREQSALAEVEASAARRNAEQAIRLDVRNAWDAVVAARAGTDAARDRLAAATRAFTLVERRYAEGLATQVEFLSARAAHTSAAIGDVVARYTLSSREVELERAAATRPLR